MGNPYRNKDSASLLTRLPEPDAFSLALAAKIRSTLDIDTSFCDGWLLVVVATIALGPPHNAKDMAAVTPIWFHHEAVLLLLSEVDAARLVVVMLVVERGAVVVVKASTDEVAMAATPANRINEEVFVILILYS